MVNPRNTSAEEQAMRAVIGPRRRAARHHIPTTFAPGRPFPIERVRGMIARMLTGQQIMAEVCAELRARPLVGMASGCGY